MPKLKRLYVCRSCGATQARWMGKCPDCNTWDSLEETTHDPSAEKDPHKALTAAWSEISELKDLSKRAGQSASSETIADAAQGDSLQAKPLDQILQDGVTHRPIERIPTGIHELDRTLGVTLNADGEPLAAGLVPGSAVLVGGEPGIGKSTLLLQAAFAWASRGDKVLYVSSEESAEQVGVRARRVGASGLNAANGIGATGAKGAKEMEAATTFAPLAPSSLFLLHDTNLARIVEQTRRVMPRILVIDSVQMIYRADVTAAPGSVTQLRRCCTELVYLAKTAGIAVVLVGHVTKDGQLAGPRLLEHLVDTVLSFEGDRAHSHRVVRSIKNRFGSTLEIGLFDMGSGGLREVVEGGVVGALANQDTPRQGCVLCPIITGTRCLLVEVQALTATGFLGAAKRKCSGLDSNRLAMLIAVLEQHAGLRLADRDIFASSVGGIKVVDPAADLGVLLAIASSHYRKAVPKRTCAMGEVGLSGEVRPIPNLEQRVREAVRLGCKTLLIPKAHDARDLPKLETGVELIRVKTVDDAINALG